MKNARIVFAVMCFSVPLSLFAQQEVRKLASETYGTSSLTYVSLSPWDFHPVDSTVMYGPSPITDGGISRTNATGSTAFKAPVRLPEGAIVSYLEMYSCGGPSVMTSYFEGLRPLTGSSFDQGPMGAGGSCGITSVTISPPELIDNTTKSYSVVVNFPQPDSSSLAAYRVGYKLQISPDPSTATFTDVPVGSLYHRFVEALVAAGITGGCGGGNYCPDAPVTRGQIAVFLSAALGLHWAP